MSDWQWWRLADAMWTVIAQHDGEQRRARLHDAVAKYVARHPKGGRRDRWGNR